MYAHVRKYTYKHMYDSIPAARAAETWGSAVESGVGVAAVASAMCVCVYKYIDNMIYM